MNYIHHIVLTVRNAKRSTEFYSKVLGWNIIEEKENYSYLVPDNTKYPETRCMLVLGEPRDVQMVSQDFNRNNIGLDHFAFAVETLEELKVIEARMRSHSIEMENSGITDDNFGGTAIFCTDPDGMKVEFHLNVFKK